MKPAILQLNPILIPIVNEKLSSLYIVHRYYELADKDKFVAEQGHLIQGVISGGHTGISNELMQKLPNLKVVAINGVGTDAVDLSYARQRGIHVTATLGALTEDVADLAIGLLLAICRGICSGDRFVRNGQWAKFPSPTALPLSRRFSGMKVGIVGMGRVGRAVASRATAFGCSITYTDLMKFEDLAYQFTDDLVDLATQSDALILCAAADKVEGIVDANVLRALGQDGFLINIARGKLVNEKDLVEALNKGLIAGAGLDVFVDEPNVPSEFFTNDRVVLQAHRASATWETRTAMGELVLESLSQALCGQIPRMSLTS